MRNRIKILIVLLSLCYGLNYLPITEPDYQYSYDSNYHEMKNYHNNECMILADSINMSYNVNYRDLQGTLTLYQSGDSNNNNGIDVRAEIPPSYNPFNRKCTINVKFSGYHEDSCGSFYYGGDADLFLQFNGLSSIKDVKKICKDVALKKVSLLHEERLRKYYREFRK